MRYTFIFAILLFSLTGLLLSSVSVDAESDKIMPDWFKNNAKWWKEGLITDTDMINALENLMIQDVIPLDKFVKSSSTETQTDVKKDGGSIPSYQKDVFGFWSEGVVSDDEIVNSVGFLMNKGIINSDKIKKEITERKEKLEFFGRPDSTDARNTNPGTYHVLTPDVISSIYKTAKSNELSMTYLQKIKSAEYDIIKNLHDAAVVDYSKKKDQTSMNTMISLDNAEKIAQSNSLLAVKIHKKSIQLAEDAKYATVKSGLDIYDLEKLVSDKQLEIDSMKSNFKTESEIKSAYKDAQKSQRNANEGLQNVLTNPILNDPIFQKLYLTNKNFITTVIGNLEYSDFKIPSNNHNTESQISVSSVNYHDYSDFRLPDSSSLYGDKALQFFGMIDPEKDYADWKTEHYGGAFVSDATAMEKWIQFIALNKLPSFYDYLMGNGDAPINSPEWKAYHDIIDPTELTTTSTPTFMILSAASNTGDVEVEIFSDELYDENSQYYWIDLTLPDGTPITIMQKIPGSTISNILDYDIIQGHDLLHETVDLKTGQTEGYSSTDRCGVCGEFGFDPNNPRCQYCGDEFAPYVEDNTCSACEGKIGDDDICPDCGTNWGPEGHEDDTCAACGEVIKEDDKKTIDEQPSKEPISTTNSDGTVTTVYPDGTTVWLTNAGSKATITYPNGLKEVTSFGTTFSGKWQVKLGTGTWTFDTYTEAYTSIKEIVKEYLAGKTSNTTDNPTSSNTAPNTSSEYTMHARIINGKAYPVYQFMIFSAYSGCSDSYLGVSPYGWKNSAGQFVVYHIDNDSVGWIKPTPAGCGFGKVSSTSYVEDYPISSSQATDWKNRFSISITNP